MRMDPMWIRCGILLATATASPAQTTAPAIRDGGLPADTRDAREVLTQFGDAFSADYSPHFTIISDASRDKVDMLRRLAESTFEAVERFARDMKLPVTRPRRKMTVIFFNQWGSYEQYAERTGLLASQWVPGFFDQHTGRCIMFNYADASLIQQKRDEIAAARQRVRSEASEDLEANSGRDAILRDKLAAINEMASKLDELELQINQTVFRHELAHQVLYHFGLQRHEMKRRRWLQEGLATQFESPSGLNHYRLTDFREIAWDKGNISLRSLLTDPDLLGPATEESSAAYAAAWALVYYLIEKYPTDFAWYMNSMANPDEIDDESDTSDLVLFEQAFGRIDSAFENRWRAYIHRLDATAR